MSSSGGEPTLSPTAAQEVRSLGVHVAAPATAGAVAAPGATLSAGGVLTILGATGGTDTKAAARASSPAVVSGTAFTPSATTDAMVYVQADAAAAGTVTLTMGPTTGAEHTVANALALTAGVDALLAVRVPAGWKVVVTVATATIGAVLVVTC